MELCNVKKNSLPVNVLPAPKTVPPPTIAKPLIGCSLLVHLTDCIPGAEARVFAESGGNTVLLGVAKALGTAVTVWITPPLKVGWSVAATQTVCGKVSKAAKATVGRAPEKVPAPQLLPAIANKSYVEAANLVPGGIVEVEEISVYNQVIGKACAKAKTSAIGLNLPIFAGARLHARQTLCTSSPYSTTIDVAQPEEWPLGGGSFKAGFRLASDIPVSAGITFQGSSVGPCNGGL